MLKNSLFLAFLFFFKVLGYGQKGSEFWFAAPDLQRQHGDSPIFFRFSTFEFDAKVTVLLPADPSFKPIQIDIQKKSSFSLDITSFLDKIENSIANTILKKGILIRSTCDISVYYDIANVFNGDLYSLKGDNALGLKFTIPFQMDYRGRNYPAYRKVAIILSTEDNNSITIKAPRDLNGIKANEEIIIKLNRGETYLIENTNTSPSSGPGGTIVTSEKPISITVNDDSIALPGYSCADSAGDQLIPDDLAGNSFVLSKGYLFSSDAFYIFSIEDSTKIFIEDSLVRTINSGEYYSGRLNKNSIFINTSKPVHIFHVSGFGCELGGAIIPAIRCTGSKSVSVTRATNQDFFINIICLKEFIGGFQFNNNKDFIKEDDFQTIDGTDGKWMSARITVPLEILSPQNSGNIFNNLGVFHLGVIHGDEGTTTRFGYFSDFSSSEIKLNSDLGDNCLNFQNFCLGSRVEINASGEELFNFYWVNNKGEKSEGSSIYIDSFNAEDRGFYTVYANDGGFCGESKKKIFLRGNENEIDSIKMEIEINERCDNNSKINFFSNVFSSSQNQVLKYLWKIGDNEFSDSTILNYRFDSAGIYLIELEIIDQGGCIKTTNSSVEILSSPKFSFDSENNFICEGDSTFLKIKPDSFHNVVYSWYRNGLLNISDTIKTLTVKQGGDYQVLGKNLNNCENLSQVIKIEEKQGNFEFIQDTICFGESLFNYSKSGIFIDSLTNIFGCDSVTELDLTVLPANGTTLNYLFCESSELNINGTRILETGSYTFYFLDQFGCDSIVTVNAEKIKEGFLGFDTTICGNSAYEIKSPYKNSIWSNGTVGSSIKINKNQFLTSRVNGFDNCYIEDSIYVEFAGNIYLPNAFSPNNDGINDCYGVLTNFDGIRNFEFIIFDRWGEQLFKTQNIEECWDGIVNGIHAPLGVYLYVLIYEYEDCPIITKFGDFLLIQ